MWALYTCTLWMSSSQKCAALISYGYKLMFYHLKAVTMYVYVFTWLNDTPWIVAVLDKYYNRVWVYKCKYCFQVSSSSSNYGKQELLIVILMNTQ